MRIAVLLLFLLTYTTLSAQNARDSSTPSNWTKHFQLTVIAQNHLKFHSAYSGKNSLADTIEPNATSITSTLFLGRKLWHNAAFYFDPELSGGRGVSGAVGVAGALNGETYRIGSSAPVVTIARAYFQQHFKIGNSGFDTTADDVNHISGRIPSSRLTVSIGKFSISDFFDLNKYSHDPRAQFLNWSIMSNGAWDYPANTKGYTQGVVVELIKPKWALRASSVAVGRIANSSKMEYILSKAHSESFEFETHFSLHKHPGIARLLITNSISKAPSYKEGLNAIATNNKFLLDVISGNEENDQYGGKKFGIGLNMEQDLTNNTGVFMRAGYNDGKYATWAFTEIDQTLVIGSSIRLTKLKRKNDILGLALVINGLSDEHKTFIKSGGYGFIIGDGKLNYAPEQIIEMYYNAQLFNNFALTFDYQFVDHPAYNKDRGPVHAFAVRGHIQF